MKKLFILLSILFMGFNVTACNASSKAKVSSVPSIFNNLSKYKLVNRKDYIIGQMPGPRLSYFFQTNNKWKLVCGLGTVNNNPDRNVACFGYLPDKNQAPNGSLDLRPGLSYQSIGFDNNAATMDIEQPGTPDNFVERESNIGHKSAKILPVGYRILIPKSTEYTKKELKDNFFGNFEVNCVVFDENQVGCINSDQHGFLVTADDVKLF